MSDTPSDNRSHADTTPDNSDGTLGGYLAVHSRPPAYEGTDGHPYTVSIELEHTGNLRAPYSGYLVFPRWAETGVGIVGHVETDTVIEARTETWRRSSRFMPRVTARNSGARPGGSMVTSMVTKALKRLS